MTPNDIATDIAGLGSAYVGDINAGMLRYTYCWIPVAQVGGSSSGLVERMDDAV